MSQRRLGKENNTTLLYQLIVDISTHMLIEKGTTCNNSVDQMCLRKVKGEEMTLFKLEIKILKDFSEAK